MTDATIGMSSEVPPAGAGSSPRDALLRLKGQVSRWTLAQDAELYKALEAFSSSFEARAAAAAASVDELSLEITRAQIKLNTAANELSALSRTQFMEHRVYEEDGVPEQEEAAAASEVPPVAMPSEAEREAALVRECANLVQAGLTAMASFPLDDEEPEDAAAAMLPPIPGHSYADLALPFVIGTPEFLADDTCGLYDPEERETARTTVDAGGDPDRDDDDDDEDEEEEDTAASRPQKKQKS